MRERFVGREQELTAARELMHRARSGRPQPLVISGASGAGKTMLLQVVTDEAARAGFRVLSIAGHDGSPGGPFAAFRDALPSWRDADDDPSWHVDELGRGLAAAIDGTSRQRGTRDVVVMDAVRQLLEATTFHHPVLLAVDDLQLIDADSADVVLYLMRHVRRHRVMIVATVRTDPARPEDLDDDIRRFHDAGHVDELELGPLDDDELAELVTARVGLRPDAALVDILRRRTDGMPFFAAELIGALASDGLVVGEDGTVSARDGDRPLPRRVATTVLHRVFMLGADARRVATAVALLGHVPVERLSTLAAVTKLGLDRTDDAFDRLVRARVLVADGPTYRFHHAIVRDAILADLHTATRRRMHGAIAKVLVDERRAGESRDIDEICEHFRQAVAERDPDAAALLTEAGDAMADAAPARAAEWYRMALVRLRPDDPAVADVQLRLGRALGLDGRPNESSLVVAAALRRLPVGPARSRAVTIAAHAAFAVGRFRDAAALLDGALADEPVPSARLLLHRAQVHSWAGEDAAASRQADEATKLGALDDDPILLTVRINAALGSGDFVVAAALAARLQAATVGASPASRRKASLTSCFVTALHFDPAAAVEEAAAIADGAPMAGWFRGASSMAQLRLGRLADAIRDAQAARATVDPDAGDLLLGLFVYVLVRSHLERGELDRADEVARWARDTPVTALQTGFDCAWARLHTARGDHDLAAELLRRVVEREEAQGRVDAIAMVLAEQVDAALLAGQAVTVRAANARLQQVPCDDSAIALTSSRLLADAVATRDRDIAMQAHEHAARHGLALDAARALALAGSIAGDVTVLVDAHHELGRLGAVVRQRRVAVRLRALGRRPATARRLPDDVLSPIEAEVATLVADGLTNRQVAAKVNLSPKTIEVYLSRIYAKTACRSRVELAVAVRAGALSTPA